MDAMRYQPQGRAVVRGEWAQQGLANATLFQVADTDVAGRSGLSRVGTGHALSATPAGLGVSQNGGANVWQTNTLGQTVGAGPHFTVMLTFRLNSLGQTQKYLVVDGSSTRQAAVIYGYVANAVEFFSSGHSGTDPRTGSQIVINDLLPHTVIYTYDGVTLRGFLDGVEKIAVAKNFTLLVGSSQTGFIGGSSASGNVSNATFLAHARFNRGLPRDVARELSANPWQLFANPEGDDDYVLRGAGGSSLIVTPASLLLGGGDVAMRTSRRISVSNMSLSAAGSNAAFRASRKVGIAPASLAITPLQAAIKVARRINLNTASIAVQSGGVSVRASRRQTVASISMALSGGSIQFAYTPMPPAGSYAVAIDPAALLASFGNVAMRVQRKLSVSRLPLSMSTFSVGMTYSVSSGYTYTIDSRRVLSLGSYASALSLGGEARRINIGGEIRILNTQGG